MPPDPHRVEICDRIRLQHILDAARDVSQFMIGRSRVDLDRDTMLARAVMHAIQEIGEAASRVSEPSRARIPGVPWTKIVGMRHRLVHVYSGVNMNLVWEVITSDLAPLIAAIKTATQDWPMPTDSPS